MSVAEEHIARQGVSHSAPDMFLKKPFSAGQLLTSVKSLLLCVQSVERLTTALK